MHISPLIQLIILIVIVIINVILGIFVFINNPKSATNWILGILFWVTSAWLVILYVSLKQSNPTTLLWIRLSLFLGAPQAALFYLLAKTLPKEKLPFRNSTLTLIIIATVIVMLDAVSPYAFTHLQTNPGGTPQPQVGPGMAIFAIFAITCSSLAVLILIKRLKKSIGKEKQQLLLLTYGILLMLGLIIGTILIPVVIFQVNTFVAFAPLYALIFLGTTTYAIVKHQLLDVRVVVARSVAYVLLLISLSVLYSLLAFEVGGLFFHSASVSASQQYFNVAVAILLAFTFQPLRRFFEKGTDRIFYRDKYDPQALVNSVGRVLAAEIELPKLAQGVMSLLSTNLRVGHVDILVLQGDTIYYEAGAYFTGHLPAVAHDLMRLGENTLVADELAEGDQKEILRRYNVSVFTVLKTHAERTGYLLFSDKRNGDIYNNADLRVINIVADELAIAVQNAKSYSQIQHFNQTLQQRITQATAELREANAHLQQLDEVKDEFMSMAAHQLGTPLTVIDGYISMVSGNIYGPLTPRQREPLDKALHRVRLLKRLVADFLNISRIEAGRFFLDVAPTDLNKVVPEEVDMLAERAREKEATVHYVAPSTPLPMITIDEQKTRQAIMNLIDNAIYYTPKGHVTVSLSATEHEAIFKVVDDGIGVPKEAQKKLFSKFFRAGNAKKERPNGTGIGLFLVQQMVEVQGGKIIFSSVEGKGSTFGFSLPLHGVPASALAKNPTDATAQALAPARKAAIPVATAAVVAASAPALAQTPAQTPTPALPSATPKQPANIR